MRDIAKFKTFLIDVVNLNQTRITTLEDRVPAINEATVMTAQHRRLGLESAGGAASLVLAQSEG